MNTAIVTRLVLKDWYMNRQMFLAALLLGLGTLVGVAMAKATMIALILGVIVLATIFIGMGAIIMGSPFQERKQQTLPFVMSLPISYLEYTTSKLAGGLLIFSMLWSALLLGMVSTILYTPWFAHGLVPFVVIMSVEMLVSTTLIAAASIITESQGWAVGVTQIGSLALNVVGWSIVRLPGIGPGMTSHTVHWTSTAFTILLVEFAIMALLIATTFYVQSRKRDFI